MTAPGYSDSANLFLFGRLALAQVRSLPSLLCRMPFAQTASMAAHGKNRSTGKNAAVPDQDEPSPIPPAARKPAARTPAPLRLRTVPATARAKGRWGFRAGTLSRVGILNTSELDEPYSDSRTHLEHRSRPRVRTTRGPEGVIGCRVPVARSANQSARARARLHHR